MSRMFFRLMIATIVSAAAIAAQGPDYTLKIDVPIVSVDVTVQDPAGKPVNDLLRDGFEIYENGVRQDIRFFFPVSTPYNVLLLFDRSGSTQDKWPLMQRAVAGFITSLRPQDRVSIAAFDSDFQVLQPWTADRRQALLTLPQLLQGNSIGGTNFYGAVEQVLRKDFRKTSGRRALVILTDGRDTSFYKDIVTHNRMLDPRDEHPFQNALKAARTQRIPVYFVAFNTDRNLQPNGAADEYRSLQKIFRKSDVPDKYLTAVRERMELLAEVSAGRMLFPKTLGDIVPLYEQIGRELGTSYSIGYLSSNSAADGTYRRIEVRARGSNLQLVQSRDGYYAR